MRASKSQKPQNEPGPGGPQLNQAQPHLTMEPDTPNRKHITRKISAQACKSNGSEMPPSNAGASATSSRGNASGAGKTLQTKADPVVRKRSTSLSLQDPHANGDIKCEGTEVNPSSQSKSRRCVDQSSHASVSEGTAQTRAATRTSKDKGKSAAISLPWSSVPNSPQAMPCASTRAFRTSGGFFPQSSKGKGKVGDSRTVSFAVPDANDNKGKLLYAAAKLLYEKSVRACWDPAIAGHIKTGEGIPADHPLEPLGTRCQLCKLDLAFAPKTSKPFRAGELPPAAVLSCGHCYHNTCVEEVFGPVEPPCITCLEC